MPKKKQKPSAQPYSTLPLAEKATVDPRTKASRPSAANAERMRDWSIENKL